MQSVLNARMDQMADLVQKLGTELRSGIRHVYENLMGFFHAIDWKDWAVIYACITSVDPFIASSFFFLSAGTVVDMPCFFSCIVSASSFYFPEEHKLTDVFVFLALGGVYLAERLNSFLAGNWTSFAGQNYFDRQGLFLSVLWSGPLLVIVILILVNNLFSLFQLIVGWKRAELRHRARVAITKED